MSKKVTATILFVDIMDSMEMANYWDTIKYSDFLNEFQCRMQDGVCLWKRGIKQVKLAGDELVVFYCSENVAEDILNAVQLANTLKILWYVSEPNLRRVKEGKKIDFETRSKMYSAMINQLKTTHSFPNVALCKETVEMWNALGLDCKKIKCNCVW